MLAGEPVPLVGGVLRIQSVQLAVQVTLHEAVLGQLSLAEATHALAERQPCATLAELEPTLCEGSLTVPLADILAVALAQLAVHLPALASSQSPPCTGCRGRSWLTGALGSCQHLLVVEPGRDMRHVHEDSHWDGYKFGGNMF